MILSLLIICSMKIIIKLMNYQITKDKPLKDQVRTPQLHYATKLVPKPYEIMQLKNIIESLGRGSVAHI